MTPIKRALLQLLAGATLAWPALHAAAQPYPTKPVRLLTSDGPGGVVDHLLRAMAPRLAESLKQPVVVENRPGADGMIGMEACVRAQADGHTLCGVTVAGVSVVPQLRKLAFDPLADLVAITPLVHSSGLVFANPGVPAANLREFVALARQQPGRLAYASFGNGSLAHLVFESIKRDTGIELLHVPYISGPKANTAVVGGEVAVGYFALGPMVELVRGGRVKPLAVMRSSRSPLLPEVPTALELGFKEPPLHTWFGVMAPKGLPDAVRDRVAAELSRIVSDPAFDAAVLAPRGLDRYVLSPAEFTAMLREERGRVAKLIQFRGIKAD